MFKKRKQTSCACSRNLVSSTASFLVVKVLSRNDVRRTDCALILKNKNKSKKIALVNSFSSSANVNSTTLRYRETRVYHTIYINIFLHFMSNQYYLVLLLCERLTRRLCASANRLLSCSVFNCSIRSRISTSSHISVH